MKSETKRKHSQEEQETRELFAQRLEPELIRRMEKLAKMTTRTTRQILEMAIKRALPQIEKEAGIEPKTKTLAEKRATSGDVGGELDAARE